MTHINNVSEKETTNMEVTKMQVNKFNMVLVTLLAVTLVSFGAHAQDEDFDRDFGDEEIGDEADSEEDGDTGDEDFGDTEDEADSEEGDSEESAEDETVEAKQPQVMWFVDAGELIVLISADESTVNPIRWFEELPPVLQKIIAEDGVGELNADTLGLVSKTGLEGVSKTKELIAPRLALLSEKYRIFLVGKYDCTEEEDTSALTKKQTDLADIQSELAGVEDEDEKAELETEIEALKAEIEDMKANPQTKTVCNQEKVDGLLSFATTEIWEKCTDEAKAELQPFFDGMNSANEGGDHYGAVLNASAMIDNAPDEVKDAAISEFFGAVPIPFDDIDNGDLIIARDADGTTYVGEVSEIDENGLTLTGEDGASYKVGREGRFWVPGEGGGSSGGGTHGMFTIYTGWGSAWMFNNTADRPAKDVWGQNLTLGVKVRPFKFKNARFGFFFSAAFRLNRFAVTVPSATETSDSPWDPSGYVGAGIDLAFNDTFRMGLGANFGVSTGGLCGNGVLNATLTPFSKMRWFGFYLDIEGGYQEHGIGLGETTSRELAGGYITPMIGLSFDILK